MTNFVHKHKINVIAVLCLTCFVVVCSIAAVKSAAHNQAQDTQEPKFKEFGVKRKLKQKVFKDMPVAIQRIKSLDEDGDKWFRNLQIEVKNGSDKPIYFISMTLEFPDITPDNDGTTGDIPVVTGFILRYGNHRLMDVSKLATPEDVPLKPGETYTFEIPEGRWKGLESMKARKNLTSQSTKNIIATFSRISFGDGTGFIGGSTRDYQVRRASIQ